MRDIIKQYLCKQKNKRVVTKDVEQYVLSVLGQDEYWKRGGYHSFFEAIKSLVTEGVLCPVKAWKLNGMDPGLYNGYQINRVKEEMDPGVKQELLTYYHPTMNTSYYLNNIKAYEQDRVYLSALNRFFKDNPDLTTSPFITINERSFQIFHDEKWLASSYGRSFLQNLGVTLENLRCYRTFEPFFYYQSKSPGALSTINVLIVENRDTFFSMKLLFQDGIYTWDSIPFSLLIYGEGRKIQKSFSFFRELDEYANSEAQFYYFGDLDPEGIAIWSELNKQETVEIKPFVFFYTILFEKYQHLAPLLRKEQRFCQEATEAFLSYFPKHRAVDLLQLLKEKRYLPQEGLNFQVLRELAASRE